jgi:hypothetical protein
MALEGNFRRKLKPKDKAPILKASVRHGDVIHLPGQPVPERYSRAKIAELKRRGYFD